MSLPRRVHGSTPEPVGAGAAGERGLPGDRSVSSGGHGGGFDEARGRGQPVPVAPVGPGRGSRCVNSQAGMRSARGHASTASAAARPGRGISPPTRACRERVGGKAPGEGVDGVPCGRNKGRECEVRPMITAPLGHLRRSITQAAHRLSKASLLLPRLDPPCERDRPRPLGRWCSRLRKTRWTTAPRAVGISTAPWRVPDAAPTPPTSLPPPTSTRRRARRQRPGTRHPSGTTPATTRSPPRGSTPASPPRTCRTRRWSRRAGRHGGASGSAGRRTSARPWSRPRSPSWAAD